jgi:hypothetical protein
VTVKNACPGGDDEACHNVVWVKKRKIVLDAGGRGL